MEAVGESISVYVKTDKTDWELIDTYTDVKDALVSRIKRKKFKDIQLKIYSTKPMKLESIIIEFFIGGYVKRM